MSRFNNNRGGLGMNNFQPRRGGGAGGPIRGGLMGNPNFRNHPFQNQNRRGGNNNFNRPPIQGIAGKPQQNQSIPIIPPPSPGPALTMKGPMQQQQQQQQQKLTEQEQQQRNPTPTSAQPKIQTTPSKPIVTSPQPNEANKNQNQPLKSPSATASNNQQPKQPPHSNPKSAPHQGQRTGPQHGQRSGPPMTKPQQGRQEKEKMAKNNPRAESDGSTAKV